MRAANGACPGRQGYVIGCFAVVGEVCVCVSLSNSSEYAQSRDQYGGGFRSKGRECRCRWSLVVGRAECAVVDCRKVAVVLVWAVVVGGDGRSGRGVG